MDETIPNRPSNQYRNELAKPMIPKPDEVDLLGR